MSKMLLHVVGVVDALDALDVPNECDAFDAVDADNVEFKSHTFLANIHIFETTFIELKKFINECTNGL